ncbi:MAG: quinone-dependent dihydroorotate dehydrogenase [Fimbriimonas sp.]
MSLYEALIRPVAFSMDPESVHEKAMALIERGLIPATANGIHRPVTCFGVLFPNPIGLAAGFDKNAVAVEHWHKYGFGFAEIGTVTRHAQPGNPKPRLFRLPEDSGLINRMGFNNDGCEVVAERLRRSKPRIPIGVNLGKSKITPLEEAADDYLTSFRALAKFGSYVVINVSSPNTAGLRSLQEKGPLLEIARALRQEDPTKPLLVKVAPDLTPGALDDVLEVAFEAGLAGLIATNTTISRQGLRHDPNEQGGLSGKPVTELANAALDHLAKGAQGKLTLIGVGGIFTADDVQRKLDLGASLVQLYTGWVYGGPGMVPSLLQKLAARE